MSAAPEAAGMIEFALRYATAGRRVLPLHTVSAGRCSCGKADCRTPGKHPRTEHGASDATTDADAIRRWWRRWPDANVGMALDGLVVVDIDPRNGGDADLLPHALPDTCTQRTGSGGSHHVYLAVNGTRYPGKLLDGIDLKHGANAYIVAEPSVHASGERYVWLDESEPWAMTPTDAPAWLAMKDTPKASAPLPATTMQADADMVRELRSALASMRSDDRELWVRMGLALACLGDVGRGLWLEWSMTSEKYDAADAARVWDSFQPSATDYRAVFAEAQRAGWVNPRARGAATDHAGGDAGIPPWVDEGPPREGATDAPRGESKRSGPKYSIVLARDFLVREDLAYFIKGIWQKDTFGVTWGPSSGGKSYVTADMVLHVVSGREWCGRRVKRAGVVYLGAEGARSMERRFIAMCDRMGLDRANLPLAILSGALHMLKDIDGAIVAIADAAQQLRDQFGVSDVLLVIDTLARSAPGMDENGPEDMGAYVGAVDRIRLDLGMAVVVVHHAGKDIARGARGHGALKAAADCELMIADHQVSVEKLRDGATGAAIPFTLHPVELGRDEDGDPITACWVEYSDETDARRGKAVRISPTTQIGFDALREAIRDHGERLPATTSLPEGRTACTVEQWRAQFYARTADREAESRKKAFQRAKDDLMARKIIGAWETRVWIW